MIEGVDYSFARPSPTGLFKAGKRFAVRYLPSSGGEPDKQVDNAEVRALHDAGLAVVLNWENRSGDARRGFNGGVSDAKDAAILAFALDAPATAAIYFSVDFDATAAELLTVRRYFDGVASVLPKVRIGVYGGIRTITAAKGWGTISWFWQTYAWSAGKVGYGVNLYQYHNGVTVAGGDCDLDRALTAHYGQWEKDMAGHTAEEVDWQVSNVPAPGGSRGLLTASIGKIVTALDVLEKRVAALEHAAPSPVPGGDVTALRRELSDILISAADDLLT